MPQAFDELLRRLVEARVRFVLIGGLALGARGVVRGTQDVDIVPDDEPSNLAAIASVAVAVKGFAQSSESLVSSERGIAMALAAGEHVSLQTDLGRLDVIQGLAGVPTYSKLKAGATEVEVEGVSVSVCSVEDLREMKRSAGRTRDLADLEDLDAALGED